MKKVNLYSMAENLEKAKLDKILGGANVTYAVDSAMEVTNLNKIDTCRCTYKNKSSLTNTNQATICSCVCV